MGLILIDGQICLVWNIFNEFGRRVKMFTEQCKLLATRTLTDLPTYNSEVGKLAYIANGHWTTPAVSKQHF